MASVDPITPVPPKSKEIRPILLFLAVYIFEFICYLAGRKAMPGWYESATLPKWALHDWTFNIIWIIVFAPFALFLISSRKPIEKLPGWAYMAIGFLGCFALENWALFGWQSWVGVIVSFCLTVLFFALFVRSCPSGSVFIRITSGLLIIAFGAYLLALARPALHQPSTGATIPVPIPATFSLHLW